MIVAGTTDASTNPSSRLLITDAVKVSGWCSNDERTCAARTASACRSASVADCTKNPAPQEAVTATVNDQAQRVNDTFDASCTAWPTDEAGYSKIASAVNNA
jgi:hypothetical protein